MKVKYEIVSPKKAAEWLKFNTSNRPLKPTHIKKLARDIANDQWDANGETIKFADDGTLIDGQNRLHAVIIADKPISTLVVRNLPRQVFKTIDENVPRKPADTLSCDGEANSKTLAAAVRLVWQILGGSQSDHPKMSNTEAISFLRDHPGIRESVKFAVGIKARVVMPEAQAAAMHYLCSRKSKQAADKFWTAVVTGEELKRQTPEFVLRRRLEELRVRRSGRFECCAVSAKAWNAFRRIETISQLRWGETEKFPDLV